MEWGRGGASFTITKSRGKYIFIHAEGAGGTSFEIHVVLPRDIDRLAILRVGRKSFHPFTVIGLGPRDVDVSYFPC